MALSAVSIPDLVSGPVIEAEDWYYTGEFVFSGSDDSGSSIFNGSATTVDVEYQLSGGEWQPIDRYELADVDLTDAVVKFRFKSGSGGRVNASIQPGGLSPVFVIDSAVRPPDVSPLTAKMNSARGLEPGNILVVYNQAETSADEVAAYYAANRKIPAGNVLALDLGDWDYQASLGISQADARAAGLPIWNAAVAAANAIAAIQWIGTIPGDVIGVTGSSSKFASVFLRSLGFSLHRWPSGETVAGFTVVGSLPAVRETQFYNEIGSSDRRSWPPLAQASKNPAYELLPRVEQKYVFIVCQLPFDTYSESPEQLAYRIIADSLLREAQKTPTFDQITVTEAREGTGGQNLPGDGKNNRPILWDMEMLRQRVGVDHPVENAEWNTSSGGYPQSADAYIDYAGNVDDSNESAEGISIWMPGDEDFESGRPRDLWFCGVNSYYGLSRVPEAQGDFDYSPGAICNFTQSHGSQRVYQDYVDWANSCQFTDGSFYRALDKQGDLTRRIYITHTKAIGSPVSLLTVYCPNDEAATYTVEVDSNFISFKADSTVVGTVDVDGMTLQEAFPVIKAAATSLTGWDSELISSFAPSRAAWSVKQGASFSMGVQQEPSANGDPAGFGFMVTMFYLQGRIGDWLLRYCGEGSYCYNAQLNSNYLHCIGDVMLKPIQRAFK
jgi:hypothetical protein